MSQQSPAVDIALPQVPENWHKSPLNLKPADPQQVLWINPQTQASVSIIWRHARGQTQEQLLQKQIDQALKHPGIAITKHEELGAQDSHWTVLHMNSDFTANKRLEYRFTVINQQLYWITIITPNNETPPPWIHNWCLNTINAPNKSE